MLDTLFDQIVRTSDAVRDSAGARQGALYPALKGCRDCGTMAMIASAILGVCADCGAELTVMADQP